MPEVTPRTILTLAVPALGVLAAEPLYVMVDTAVVGHLGAVPLAGLALAGALLSVVTSNLTFLSYGTTSRAARLFGAGRRTEAVGEGVQATWLALAVGVIVLVLGQLLADPIVRALSGGDDVRSAATSWLRIALFGAPGVLVTMAGNGWMRGVQDTKRPLYYVLAGNAISAIACPILVYPMGLGLAGSAIANVSAQYLSALLFLRAIVKESTTWQISVARIRAQVVLGRDLVLRSLAFQACLLSATTVAAQTGTATLGAQQIVGQLWMFLSLVLDSLAIAAQSLIGAELGAGAQRRARDVARAIARYSTVVGVGLGVLFAALAQLLPLVFTTDSDVLVQVSLVWWFFVALQPLAGLVFGLDGVLLGAGDVAYLRTATLASALVGYLPMIWLSLVFDWGLIGIWIGLSLFMLLRAISLLVRVRGDRWLIVGAVRT